MSPTVTINCSSTSCDITISSLPPSLLPIQFHALGNAFDSPSLDSCGYRYCSVPSSSPHLLNVLCLYPYQNGCVFVRVCLLCAHLFCICEYAAFYRMCVCDLLVILQGIALLAQLNTCEFILHLHYVGFTMDTNTLGTGMYVYIVYVYDVGILDWFIFA